MPIQRLSTRAVTVLKNPGKRSEQLVWRRNAPESSMTITRVTMEPGAESTLHAHARSEQIWLIERGAGTLLMEGAEAQVSAGNIVRTPAGEAHGIVNSGAGPLVYLSVTTPPEDFTKRYAEEEAAPHLSMASAAAGVSCADASSPRRPESGRDGAAATRTLCRGTR